MYPASVAFGAWIERARGGMGAACSCRPIRVLERIATDSEADLRRELQRL